MASKSQVRAKKADDYHARHATWVHEFNALTGGECAGGDAGVKWAAVRAWQQKHWQANNLLADGLVGPKTLEAAKLVAKQAGGAKDATPEAGGGANDDKQHATGRTDAGKEHGATDGKDAAPAATPGAAEGAEAAADKPRLDGPDADEQIAPAVASGPAPLASKKPATLPEFETAATKLTAEIAKFKPPQGEGPQRPIAQHYVEGTADKDAPPARGAMMKTDVLKGYQEAAHKLTGATWSDLGAPHARAQVLLDAVNQALAAEQVPAIHGVSLVKISNPGQFDAADWIMEMNQQIFETMTAPKNIDEIASQVFHEGRHAEQRFAVARLVAAKAKSPAEVAAQAQVQPVIAAQAFEMRATPMSAEQQKAAADFKHATVDNPAHGDIETAAGDITDAANQAAALFRSLSPEDQVLAGGRWQDLRQQAIAALDSYYHLATERDAYAAQKQLADANK